MNLSVDRFGNGPALVFCHGLFGSKDNLRSIANVLSSSYTCYLIDFRNHGFSFHDEHHSYLHLAEDIHKVIVTHSIKSPTFIGHSMGGKSVLTYESIYQSSDKIILLDILPTTYKASHSFIFKALSKISLEDHHSYESISNALKAVLFDDRLVPFFLKSIKIESEKFIWKLNLKSLEKNYKDILSMPKLNKITCPTLCLHGERSTYVTDLLKTKMKTTFTNLSYREIIGAGHWVHVDNFNETISHIKQFLL
jgi:esterase